MKPSVRLRLACAAGVLLVLAGGCTSTSADGTTTSQPLLSLTVSPSVVDPSTVSPPSSAPSSPTPGVEPPTPAPSSTDPAAQEAADRAAIETQWANFWDIYVGIVRTPADQRATILDGVSVEPAKSRVLDAASRLEADGLDYYGIVILRPYSVDIDVDGQKAVLSDCQDQSGYGSQYVGSGKKRTVGVDHNHTQAGFVRGDDGIWRVQNVQYVENIPC